jgi:DNA-directed RNA polymerase beta' subunit|tara:strand:- start:42 stop:482 length:441 start_codon:yes stop_codon:yes gene_type:complete
MAKQLKKEKEKLMKVLMKRYADENPDEMRKFAKEVAEYEKSKASKGIAHKVKSRTAEITKSNKKIAAAFKKAQKVSVKKATKKGIAKKVLGKLGWRGKVAVGALTAYDIAKSLPKGKGKACRTGQYRNKKGICVNIKGQVRKQPKE